MVEFFIGLDGYPIDPPNCYNPEQMPRGFDYLELGTMYILSAGEVRQDPYRPCPVPRHLINLGVAQTEPDKSTSKRSKRTSGRASRSGQHREDTQPPRTRTSSSAVEPSSSSSSMQGTTSGPLLIPIVYPFRGTTEPHASRDSETTEPMEDDE
jgi:hypothetical protein